MRIAPRLVLIALPVIGALYGLWFVNAIGTAKIDGNNVQGILLVAIMVPLGTIAVTSELASWYVGVGVLPAAVRRMTFNTFEDRHFDGSVVELAATLRGDDQLRVALRMLLNGTLLLVLVITPAVVEIKTVLIDAAEGTANPLLLASALVSIGCTAGIVYVAIVRGQGRRHRRRGGPT
jgi:hypothetical protein